MKIKELKEILDEMNPELEVVVFNGKKEYSHSPVTGVNIGMYDSNERLFMDYILDNDDIAFIVNKDEAEAVYLYSEESDEC